MGLILIGALCFAALVFAVYVHESSDRSANKKLLAEIERLSGHVKEMAKRENEAQDFSFKQTTDILRMRADLDKLQKLVEYHDLRLAQKPMRHVHLRVPTKKYEEKLIAKIKSQLAEFN